MYFAAKKLGRYQLADSPTTAMVLYCRSMRRRVLMSVESLMLIGAEVKGCAESRQFITAAACSACLQFRLALLFRQLGDLLHCRIEALEVAAVLRQHAAEAGYQFGIGRDRHEMGIVELPGEETIVAGIAAPGRFQGQVIGLHCSEG